MPTSLVRTPLLEDESLSGTAFCRAYSGLVDNWLQQLYVAEAKGPDEVALVAVGGYGRAELSPQSDIDVLLLHSGTDQIGEIAERIWYPIWDEGLKLGHAVRTIREALELAASDLDTATSLLSIRHLAGDEALTRALADQALALWQKRHRRWLKELRERVASRQARSGEVAFLLEPDLKVGRGGLRDVHAIQWAEAADRVMLEGDDTALTDPYEVLLSARVELHRRTGRPGDVLLLQEQDGVAEALGMNADRLMEQVSTAARTIAWRSDEVWRRIEATQRGGMGWRSARDRRLGPGVLLRDRQIHIGPHTDIAGSPGFAMRVATLAAQHGTSIDRPSLVRLRDEGTALSDPWSDEDREALVDLLAAGRDAIPVIESLDQFGIWVRFIPEWEPNRCRPQRNAYHTFTVDRHLFEAAAEAAGLVDQVDRPDLLLIGTLLHDVGKGYPGDHTEVGVDLVRGIGTRMGFPPDDVDVLVDLVRLHLLLPDVATRRDLSDEGTLRHVAEQVGTVERLRLLEALTEADSIATGPAAWGSWKAELVHELASRTAYWLEGGTKDEAVADQFPSPAQVELVGKGETAIMGDDDRLTVVWPDRPGLFSRVAGAVALNGLAVLEAAAYTHDNGMALESFRVEASTGPTIAWDRVCDDVEQALRGRLALKARLDERARRYRGAGDSPMATTVRFDLELSDWATVVEVHATDAVGLLYRITQAVAELDLDIRSAKVQTLGASVVDSFYFVDGAGRKVTDRLHLDEVERAVVAALDG